MSDTCRPNPDDRTFWTPILTEDYTEYDENFRITEDDLIRITESGEPRIVE